MIKPHNRERQSYQPSRSFFMRCLKTSDSTAQDAVTCANRCSAAESRQVARSLGFMQRHSKSTSMRRVGLVLCCRLRAVHDDLATWCRPPTPGSAAACRRPVVVRRCFARESSPLPVIGSDGIPGRYGPNCIRCIAELQVLPATSNLTMVPPGLRVLSARCFGLSACAPVWRLRPGRDCWAARTCQFDRRAHCCEVAGERLTCASVLARSCGSRCWQVSPG